MRKILLPFFILGLVVVNTPSLVRSGRTFLPPLAPLLSALMILGVVVVSYLGQLVPSPTLVIVPAAQATSTISESELSYWLKLYHRQPTHRDVLLNLTRLYTAQDNQEQAAFFWHLAQESDPNSLLVQEK
jgi:hypothetical protein